MPIHAAIARKWPGADQPALKGALAALEAARPEEHDTLIAEAAAGLQAVDTIVLGQFSMARAGARADIRRAVEAR